MEQLLDQLIANTSKIMDASCGLTMRRDDSPLTIASSDELASAVDEVQYGKDTGPCLQALITGELVSVPNMLHEFRWNTYPATAMAYGVHSSLSVPIHTSDGVVGVLNVYGREPHLFDDERTVMQATAFAAQGAALVELSLLQARQTKLTAQMHEALTGRSIIDQALGIIMAQQGCNADTAFAILRTASQGRNRKLREIAFDIVASVGGPPSPERGFQKPKT